MTDPDTRDTVAVFRGRRLRTPEDWLSWAVVCWGWAMGYHHWTSVLRGLVRSLNGLENAGLITCERQPGAPKGQRRVVRLTDEGRRVAEVLLGITIQEDGSQ